MNCIRVLAASSIGIIGVCILPAFAHVYENTPIVKNPKPHVFSPNELLNQLGYFSDKSKSLLVLSGYVSGNMTCVRWSTHQLGPTNMGHGSVGIEIFKSTRDVYSLIGHMRHS